MFTSRLLPRRRSKILANVVKVVTFSGTLQQILQFLGRISVMWFGRRLKIIEQKYIGDLLRTDLFVAWIRNRQTTL